MTDEHVICSSIIGITVIVAVAMITGQGGDWLLTAGIGALAALGGLSGGIVAANGKKDKPPEP